jgi:hypothetical protein
MSEKSQQQPSSSIGKWRYRSGREQGQTTRQFLLLMRSESIVRLNASGMQIVPFISIAAPDCDTLQTRHSIPEPLKPIVPGFMTLCRGPMRFSSMTVT